MRKLGEITSDMEKLLMEMYEDHDMQLHEMLFLLYGYVHVHLPGAIECYVEDGKSPILYYGPLEGLKKSAGRKIEKPKTSR